MNDRTPPQQHAIRVYFFSSALWSLAFSFPVTYSAVYHVINVGLTPIQLVLVGTTLELSAFLFEIPTGVVADLYSRRWSVIIGFATMGVGFIVEGLFPTFAAVLLAQVIWGLGYTFVSGAHSAWIADELGNHNLTPIFLRSGQIARAAGLVGIGLSAVVASVQLGLALVAGGGIMIVLALSLVVVMREHGYRPTPPPDRTTWQSMGDTFTGGLKLVRRSWPLLMIFGLILVEGLYSEGFDRLRTPHLVDNIGLPPLGALEPVVWFSLINAVAMVLGIGANEILNRLNLKPRQTVYALFVINAGVVVTLLAFAWIGDWWLALGVLWLSMVFRGSQEPLLEALTNENITDSRVRATVLSMSSQANALSQVVGGPPVGAIGSLFSIPVALTVSALLRAPALIFVLGLLRPVARLAPIEQRDGGDRQ